MVQQYTAGKRGVIKSKRNIIDLVEGKEDNFEALRVLVQFTRDFFIRVYFYNGIVYLPVDSSATPLVFTPWWARDRHRLIIDSTQWYFAGEECSGCAFYIKGTLASGIAQHNNTKQLKKSDPF